MSDQSTSAAATRIGGEFTVDPAPDIADVTCLNLRPHCDAEGLDEDWLYLLCDACLAAPATDPVPLLRAMRAAGIEPATIAEGYIPAAARVLGDAWCEDRADFVRVTVGCSRLHRFLREISEDWRGPEQIDPMAVPLLVVVEGGTFHTLGATVLSGALRRKGYAVRLMVGVDASGLATELRDSDYAAVLISASGRASLDAVRGLVEIAHDPDLGRLPVVVGGPIIKDGETTAQEVMSVTGADHCTDDPAEALDLCGLRAWRHGRRELSAASRQRA